MTKRLNPVAFAVRSAWKRPKPLTPYQQLMLLRREYLRQLSQALTEAQA